ncbi:RNA pseudouridine synthase [Halosquirtibacter xylanolyticus]|uniref:pseudouridine synthase n=1 Tax=Halosquirtibacter xylanolyticus TaxID=3374599 RepID=UPI00374785F9|nr:RNA pseudouridine synthase [Prolixibacteraceae bacterium]
MLELSDYIYPLEGEIDAQTTAFTFPFQYNPHDLVVQAKCEVIKCLQSFSSNTYLDKHVNQKMFGILVVTNKQQQLGYLVAISGINPDLTKELNLVPSIVSLETKDGFFRKEETYITRINQLIQDITDKSLYKSNVEKLTQVKTQNSIYLEEAKSVRQEAKRKREAIRSSFNTLSDEEVFALDKSLKQESQLLKKEYKREKQLREALEQDLQQLIDKYETLLDDLRCIRKRMSQALQQKVFNQYLLSNAEGDQINITKLFQDTKGENPPAGAGDCAAPKLLQFVYNNNLTPLLMGEFWWDPEHKDDLRRHLQFYPSCKSKCQPILGFMLQGIHVDPNPITETANKPYELQILYEDDYLMVVNKPSGLLSVPGKEIQNSVYHIIHTRHPEFEGPLLVHRLDMSTSGILIATKDLETYRRIQKQFLQKKIHKKYIALISGKVTKDNGIISLPLRVDLDNRPLQMVCEKYGKDAITHWEKISESNGKTRLSLSPITGRTHQLRVHCAHTKGLNAPILGDELYGTNTNGRLCLHAEQITFEHPYTRETIEVHCECPF